MKWRNGLVFVNMKYCYCKTISLHVVSVWSTTQTQACVTVMVLSESHNMRTWTHELNIQSCSESLYQHFTITLGKLSSDTENLKLFTTAHQKNFNLKKW